MLAQRLSVLAAALWWGSLTALGAVVVPMLFKTLPSPALAGQAAARLFEAQSWVSLGCGVLLLVASRPRDGGPSLSWAGGALAFVLGGLLLALVGQYGVSPRIVARQDLAFWHSAGSVLFALQWACALVVLARVTRAVAPVSPGDPS